MSISPVYRTVVVGPKESLAIASLEAIRPTWTLTPLNETWRGFVQVRAHGSPLPATVEPTADRLYIHLEEPATGIAPGQGVVLFEDDLVIGSGTIDASHSAMEGAR